MESILVLVGLFLIVLTSGRTAEIASADVSDWGEKEGEKWRWNVGEFPNPQTHPKYCQRYVPSNVCDPDSILTKEEADNLDTAIRRLYNDTSCLCPGCSSSSGGIIIGIAVMKHIFLPYNEHKSVIVREFADELRKLWSLGECNNDITIVLVTKDRLSSTSVGPGISSYISPRESRIFLDNKGYFTIGKYYEGLLSMVQAYYHLSQSIKLKEEEEEEVVNTGLVAGIVLGVLLLFVLVILVGCTLRKRLSRPPSRKESWDGDPSLSWKKGQYQSCNTQDLGEKMQTPKHGDTENNNDQFINKRGHVEGNEAVGQNEALLPTVAELENEQNNSIKEESDEDQDLQITDINGKNETKVKYTEVEINSPEQQETYRGTITNL